MMEQAPWPPGYRFDPSPRELILYYLDPWVTSPAGQTPFGEPEGIVCAADVYSADPGTLTSRLRHFGHDDGNWYFLCVARWKDGKARTRMSRAVQGGGTWHGSGKRMAVGRHGYRQTFEYRAPGGGKSAWLMEEIGTKKPEATGSEGVKVLCRVHRTPRAAAADDAANEERQETDEEVQLRSSKKRRCELRQEHDFAAANYSAAAPTDVGCSYASTSQTALVNAAAPTTWQQQPVMEQQGVASYHGGVYVKDEQQRLEVLLSDEEWQQFVEIDYGFDKSSEDGLFKKDSTEDTDGVYPKDEQQPLGVLLPYQYQGWQQFVEIGYSFDYSTDERLLKKNSTEDAKLNHCTGVNGGVYDVKDEQQPSEALLPDEGSDYSTEDGLLKKNSTEDAQLNHCTGVNGGVYDVKDEQQPSEALLPDDGDEGLQQFAEMGYGFDYSTEDAQLNDELPSHIQSRAT